MKEDTTVSQDGGGYPDGWLLDKMEKYFDTYPLSIGGEMIGHVFWMDAQAKKVTGGMRALKQQTAEIDSLCAELKAAQDRIKELESGAVLRVESKALTPEALESIEGDERTKGQIAYEGRVGGASWGELGKNSLLLAKNYAKKMDLEWPVKVNH